MIPSNEFIKLGNPHITCVNGRF